MIGILVFISAAFVQGVKREHQIIGVLIQIFVLIARGIGYFGDTALGVTLKSHADTIGMLNAVVAVGQCVAIRVGDVDNAKVLIQVIDIACTRGQTIAIDRCWLCAANVGQIASGIIAQKEAFTISAFQR